MQFISFAVLGKRIKVIKYLMRDKSVSFGKKALIVFGLVYLVLPVDLIPPIVPVFGFLDDLILWLFILDYLKEELDQYWVGKDPATNVRNGKKKYRGKDVVDGVEYEVREDGDGPAEDGRKAPEGDQTAEPKENEGEKCKTGTNAGNDKKVNLEKER